MKLMLLFLGKTCTTMLSGICLSFFVVIAFTFIAYFAIGFIVLIAFKLSSDYFENRKHT